MARADAERLMFDHVLIRVSDRQASERFYTLAFGEPTPTGSLLGWDVFHVVEGAALTKDLHVAFGAESPEAVDAWWRKLVEAGYTSNGEPGPRPEYNETYYGAFVLDPDGNNVEAVHHAGSRTGRLDHLWFRTPDVVAQKGFYDAVAPIVGLRLAQDSPERVRYTDGEGSFTFVTGDPPTQNVHMAFTAPDRATVDAFHAAATAAGHRDNGAPGIREQYSPTYYAAFVLDPDGHNVEAVFHG
jgi:catechol 2,3-dioxygenase-like lactoylglutathione lyase family enzyme